MMDFFASQDRARRNSRRLVALFALSVAAIVVTLNAVAFGVMSQDPTWLAHRLDVHLWVTFGTLGMIAAGSAWKTAQLSKGGSAVAAMMGGRALAGASSIPAERTLLNVVEEMAIASGTPVPQVYVLDEPGINAFAAGHGPSDAVIAVTRGCMEDLSRDELQGVIGHEFSHLLNGDMRQNLKLIGLLNGILLLALSGRLLLRLLGSGTGTSSRRERGGGNAYLALAALALLAIGYIGYFFGTLIKAALSRQREYLADASSVQFTRNPDGLAGALKKIGGASGGSRLTNERTEEVSHMFFADALSSRFLGFLGTHPPLPARIRAIEPTWNGIWTSAAPPSRTAAVVEPATLPPTPRIRSEQVVGRVGRISPDHVGFGARLLAALPAALTDAARQPYSARAAVIALLLDQDDAKAAPQFEVIERSEPGLASEVRRLRLIEKPLGDGARLPIVQLALPSLRQMSDAQRGSFLALIRSVVDTDGTVTRAEFVLAHLVKIHLDDRPSAAPAVASIRPLLPDIALLLTELARCGSSDPARASTAFAAASARLVDQGLQLRMQPNDARPEDIARALDRIAAAENGVKRRVLDACAWCVANDGEVTPSEAETLRLVADCLRCPLPPFLDQP